MDVRHAATVALLNALTFAHNNFSNAAERNYIMQVICEGTLAGAWGLVGGVRRWGSGPGCMPRAAVQCSLKFIETREELLGPPDN